MTYFASKLPEEKMSKEEIINKVLKERAIADTEDVLIQRGLELQEKEFMKKIDRLIIKIKKDAKKTDKERINKMKPLEVYNEDTMCFINYLKELNNEGKNENNK